MAYIQINGGVNWFVLEMATPLDSDDAMGRPPLGMKPTTIRLPVETLQRVEALVGNRRIALFIREAVENELARRDAPPPSQE
ncbi:hypothetical protein ACQKE8_21380 [Sphingobium limneticum]|jgi:hypothetical protein|uniref:hypothetical protein n=1 Tax=Sphingobium limneticum TaxID=1007511 RepID=UPI00137752FE|nr:hypothetical protein [Sphingobium yanoikuyae]